MHWLQLVPCLLEGFLPLTVVSEWMVSVVLVSARSHLSMILSVCLWRTWRRQNQWIIVSRFIQLKAKFILFCGIRPVQFANQVVDFRWFWERNCLLLGLVMLLRSGSWEDSLGYVVLSILALIISCVIFRLINTDRGFICIAVVVFWTWFKWELSGERSVLEFMLHLLAIVDVCLLFGLRVLARLLCADLGLRKCSCWHGINVGFRPKHR